MHSQSNKLLLIILVTVMAIAPLRGLVADVPMTMDHTIQDQATMMAMNDSMVADGHSESCDQCDMQQCCQASNCNSGHCFSCMALVALDFHQPFTQLNQNNLPYYQLSSISFQTSPLLQPPRA